MKTLETMTLNEWAETIPRGVMSGRHGLFAVFDEEDEVDVGVDANGRLRINARTRLRSGVYASCSVIFRAEHACVSTSCPLLLSAEQARAYASLIEDCSDFCDRIEEEYAKYVAGVERERKQRLEAVEQDPLVQMLIDRASYASVQVDGHLVEIRNGALSIKPVPTYEDEPEETEED